jgi:hypothetical protein
MTFKGVVSSKGNTVVLENGARLAFDAGDCATAVRPGDAVILDTERRPSIRSAKGTGAFNPVSETK